MERRQKYRKGNPAMMMNSFKMCNIRNIAMPAFSHKACCIKTVGGQGGQAECVGL